MRLACEFKQYHPPFHNTRKPIYVIRRVPPCNALASALAVHLYNGGLGMTQAEVAKELGVSRMTVARELKAMRSLCEEDYDFEQAVDAVEPNFPDKVYHRRELDLYAAIDYSEGRISRSTAYRRSLKYWGYAPEQLDKVLHELKIARRAIGRAVKAVGEEPVSEAAVSELATIAKG